MKTKISIVGASGYTGGELIRLLLQHPQVEISQVSSETYAGEKVTMLNPNLRGFTDLRFSSIADLEPCDVIFLCLPHGKSMEKLKWAQSLAPKIIDLSADCRLSAEDYMKWYGHAHSEPEFLKKFIYGIPELHREELKDTNHVAATGCNATCTILGLYPLFKADLIDRTKPIIAESKGGSSEGGANSSSASHHPERQGCVRSYKPTGHRHSAEVLQELSMGQDLDFHMSTTALSMIRGILVTSHLFLKDGVEEKQVRRAYLDAYKDEFFIRLINERKGIWRVPEPKIVMGTNFCDIGFEKDPNSNRLVVLSALDNMMKGASGQAVQCMNLICGFEETEGLKFTGLHPV